MKKIIFGILSIGVLLGMSVLIYFSFFIVDESRTAEVVKDAGQEVITQERKSAGATENNKISEENNTQIQSEIQKVKEGTFIKIDPLHYASGEVRVEKFGENYKIKFQKNFSSADGPDLFVYLSEPQSFRNTAIGGIDTKKTINLGVLKNIAGEQEYIVSKNDFEKYGSAVVIWCKKFGVQFSRADLK